jgi:hypothetical protein
MESFGLSPIRTHAEVSGVFYGQIMQIYNDRVIILLDVFIHMYYSLLFYSEINLTHLNFEFVEPINFNRALINV